MVRTNPAPLKTARWQEVRAFVAHRAGFRCEHCHVFLGRSGEVDHRIPRGTCELLGIHTMDPGNCQYLCTSCHSRKSNAERWAGHTPKPPKQPTRSKVAGRDQYLNATGIPQPERNTPC